VRLVAISVDERQDSVQLAEALDIDFPLLRDADLSVAVAYGVAMQGRDIAIPAVFVVGTNRRVRWRTIGESAIDRASVNDILEQVEAAR